MYEDRLKIKLLHFEINFGRIRHFPAWNERNLNHSFTVTWNHPTQRVDHDLCAFFFIQEIELEIDGSWVLDGVKVGLRLFELDIAKIDEFWKYCVKVRNCGVGVKRDNKILCFSVDFDNVVQVLVIGSFELDLDSFVHSRRDVAFFVDLYGEMLFSGRQDVEPLRNGCFVDDLEGKGVDFVDFVAIKFNLWWIELNVNVAVGFFKGVCGIEEVRYFFRAWGWCF